MDDQTDKNNQDLRNKAQELKNICLHIIRSGQEFVRLGQIGVDLANSVNKLLESNPIITNLELVDKAIEGMYSTFQKANEVIDPIIPVLSTTSASAVSICRYAFDPENVTLLADDDYLYLTQYSDMKLIADLLEDKKKAIELLRKFGFEQGYKSKKSALDHFETALKAFESPVNKDNPVASSLIPMRSAINIVVSTLLRNRPSQTKTKNNYSKIQSIGRQLHRLGISEETITGWGLEYERLNKELSSAKDRDMTREEWRILIRDSTIFIQELLEGIDQEKMKK